MFGPLGGQEFILILVIALLLFGPRKLPQIGKSLGRALAEFRGATNEFKRSLEREVDLEEIKEARDGISSVGNDVAEAVRDAGRAGPARETVVRSGKTAPAMTPNEGDPTTAPGRSRESDAAAPPDHPPDGETPEQS